MAISIIKKSQLHLIFSLLGLIAIGTLLLKLPMVIEHGETLTWLESLYAATSSVCVTGLTLRPVTDFNLMGQLIMIFLVQLGALGIMTISTSVILMLGHSLTLDSSLMNSSLLESMPRRTEELTKIITTYTLVIEGIGMILLTVGFLFSGYPFFESLYLGFFHAISSFCNAGISPLENSIIGQSDWTKVVICILMICGGLGMYVIYDLVHFRKLKRKLSINTRLILIATLLLLAGGTAGMSIMEHFAGHNIGFLDTFFQVASARTCGHNGINLSELTNGTLALLILLMLIGGAPGSVAGGMKLTGVSLAAISIYNTFKGNTRVLLFKREIPMSNILKSYTLVVTYLILVAIGTLLLLAIGGTPGMMQAMFETASALGTVGLSIFPASQMTEAGQITEIILMFIGRVGPFTLFLFLLGREKKNVFTYPVERVVIN